MSDGMHFLSPNEYQKRVEQHYLELKAQLSKVVPFAEIEHVGSSAITGAISKGDLDLLVRVSRDQFSEALNAIEAFGFSIKQGTLRTAELCMLEGPGDTAIQLIERGSKFEMFSRFRDILNANPDLVEKYNALKRSCSGLPQDEYRVQKSKFIQTVLGE